MELKSDFKTKDIGEAGFLVAHGLSLKGIEPAQGYKLFVFDEPRSVLFSQQYWAGGLVNARAFSLALRDLKDRLFRIG